MRARGWMVLRFVTVAGWAAMVLAATPWGDWIGVDIGRLSIGAAACGTLALIMHSHALAVSEVYEAGKVAGLREAGAGDPPRHLRAVSG